MNGVTETYLRQYTLSPTKQSKNPFDIDFFFEKKDMNDEDSDNASVCQSTNDRNNDNDIDNKNAIKGYGSSISFNDLDEFFIDPMKNEPFHQSIFDGDNSSIQPDIAFDFLSDDYQTHSQIVEKKTPKTCQERKPEVIPFVVKSKQLKIRERKDYLIKKVKSCVAKYLMKLLNSKSKLHFYTPNSLEFNSQIGLAKNKQWLSWSIQDILTTYDKPNNKNNKSIIEKIELCPEKYDDILKILSKSYESILEDYFQTKQCIQDANKYDKKTKEQYLDFCQVKQGSFIDYIKNTKGNNKKTQSRRKHKNE